jgi:hypothetical protein
VIFWLNILLGLLAFAATSTLLRRLPRHERPHRLDLVGATLIVTASVAFMLALNLGGKNYPWVSPQVLGLFAMALAVGVGFVRRLMVAPEPLIPVAILVHPIVRLAVLANALGWGSIIALNIFLPIYLQSVIGLSPTSAGLSLMVLMVSLNSAAGVAGQLLGRVTHYKLLPTVAYVFSIASVLALAWWADRMTPLWFQALLFVIGIGFGPTPSMTAVAMQNVVARHQLGIAVGTMNFSRSLLTTILVALLGVIVLTATSSLSPSGGGHFGGTLSPEAANAARAFSHAFYVIAAAQAISFVAVLLMEEKPLRASDDDVSG